MKVKSWFLNRMLYGVSPDFIIPDSSSNMADNCLVYLILLSSEISGLLFSNDDLSKILLVAVVGVPKINKSKISSEPYFFYPQS